MEPYERLSRVERWERRMEIPLLLLAVAFVAAYAISVLSPDLDPDLETVVRLVSWTTWVAFGADFLVRIVLAENRLRYVTRHWYDVILLLVPAFRPLRLLRMLGTLRVLNRVFARRLAGRQAAYVVCAAVLCVFLGALAVLDMERHSPDANITTYGDALWWAMVTSTTVGYGDFYPVTTGGRLVAVGLMIMGIALLGSVTGTFATWLVEAVKKENAERDRIRAEHEAQEAAQVAAGAASSTAEASRTSETPPTTRQEPGAEDPDAGGGAACPECGAPRR